mmetsp:Transcript_6279/g.15263  ORF Transcript_6279/g.15263 Transcript_6279/m.15263 type:complete len:211 (+) Transcript_6279:586-1218(+)
MFCCFLVFGGLVQNIFLQRDTLLQILNGLLQSCRRHLAILNFLLQTPGFRLFLFQSILFRVELVLATPGRGYHLSQQSLLLGLVFLERPRRGRQFVFEPRHFLLELRGLFPLGCLQFVASGNLRLQFLAFLCNYIKGLHLFIGFRHGQIQLLLELSLLSVQFLQSHQELVPGFVQLGINLELLLPEFRHVDGRRKLAPEAFGRRSMNVLP